MNPVRELWVARDRRGLWLSYGEPCLYGDFWMANQGYALWQLPSAYVYPDIGMCRCVRVIGLTLEVKS